MSEYWILGISPFSSWSVWPFEQRWILFKSAARLIDVSDMQKLMLNLADYEIQAARGYRNEVEMNVHLVSCVPKRMKLRTILQTSLITTGWRPYSCNYIVTSICIFNTCIDSKRNILRQGLHDCTESVKWIENSLYVLLVLIILSSQEAKQCA